MKALIGKTLYHSERGTRRYWGKLIDIDPKTDEVIVYTKNNPDGYRIFRQTIQEIQRWMKEGKLTF